MSKVSELINKLTLEGVRFASLKEVACIEKGTQVNRETLRDEHPFPVFNGGINASGRHVESNYPSDTITISQGGASAGFVNFVREDFWLGAHCYALLPRGPVHNRFLYFVVKNSEVYLRSQQMGAGIPSLSKETLSQLKVPVPPIEVQREIVSILDKFTELEAVLEAELEARQKQLAHYRRKILSSPANPMTSMTLGDLCNSITTGKLDVNAKIDGGRYPFFTCDAKPYSIDTFAFDSEAILISGNGSRVGHVNYYQGKFNAYQRTYVLSDFSPLVTVPYLLHNLRASFREYVGINSRKGSVPYITLPLLSAYTIQLPSLEKQVEATAILDKLEALVGESEIGLPAEISARRKQYEYYRNKLLTFKELEVA